ncbi:MAG: HAMP domain-containing sensor histidine kinase, partial [Rhodoglobus sp.]
QGTWYIVTARSEAASRLVLAGLTRVLIISLTGLTLLFGAASWALTGAALRPVTRLRLSAETIVATGSAELLPTGPAHDEVSDLATTLNRLIGDLRSAAEREKQLVSDASHELRTPLAILEAQLELMGTADRATAASDLEAAQRAAHRLSVLVANLLELSQLESDGGDHATPVSAIVDELEAAIDRARLAAASTGVTIDYDISAADAAGTVALSAHDFGRVVDNLVGNSLKAVGGAGRIDVSLDIDVDAVSLLVSDSGPGIPAEFLPRAFDRFSRADEARGGVDGTGLGLAIVAAAVESAHGTVSLANRGGGGVDARVVLPVSARTPSATQP